ncbi:MAG: tetratricopeptide repeat protein, partial [Phaeodactylibacter sp.]|nr:tetratricopeptide repeat protein [Phaeodactylibacter sp.]
VEMAVIGDFVAVEERDQYIQTPIALGSTHLPPDHRLLALAYRQRAESSINQQEHDSSLLYLNRAIPILEKEKDWNNWTMCRLMVGINYYFLKEYGAMDSAFVLVQAHLHDPAVSVSTRSNVSEWLGIQARIKGDYDAGIRYFRQVIELETSVADIDSLNLFGQYYQLGNFYYYKGDYRRALEYYAVARNIYLTLGEEDDNLSLAYFQIGSINTRLQNYPEAIRNLKQSLAVSERIEAPYPEDIINAKNVLGKCYIELEQFDSAFFYLQGALAVPHTFGKATTNGRLGVCYKATGQIDTAIVYLQKALELYGNSKNGMNALWNMHLADCYSQKADYPTAFSYHQKALMASGPAFEDSLAIHANPSLEHAQFPIYLLQALHAKAQTLAAYTADPQALQTAFQTYQLAVTLIDSLKADYVLESSQLTWGKTFKQIYAEGIEVARRLHEQIAQSDYLNEAFVFMEKSKSSLLLDALRSAEGKALGGVPDSLSRREKELVV